MTITCRVLDLIREHARASAPRECCGLLLGASAAITDAAAIPNIASDPDRYLLDPKAHIDARRAARRRGLDVVGFYHSHPHSAPVPSATDLAEASYVDCVYLIAGTAAGPDQCGEIRLYRFTGSDFRQEQYATVP
jgi:proteasome lid subunit RPN8/RPN11